jgi:3'(2'), 5'-bisphosphate nucleotidase
MIGLLDGATPALGVVYQPIGDKLYYATRGGGAFLQEGQARMHDQATRPAPRRLRVSDVREPAQIRMVASKSHRTEAIDRVRAALGISDELNVGSVGLKLGLIAEGVRDLYVNPAGHSKLWDACGPEAILVEAGGRLSDLRGQPLDYRGAELGNTRGLIASNGVLHDEVVARLGTLFPGGAPRE